MKHNKKKKGTNLFVRELTLQDAHSYSKISTGVDLHNYTRFFEAHALDEACKIIERYSTKYEQLYGLFTKANRLVAVFDVSSDVEDDGATVHYFVGERYYGNGYATLGITILAETLSDTYSHFHFEVSEENIYSILVQKHLGSVEGKTMNTFRSFTYTF